MRLVQIPATFRLSVGKFGLSAAILIGGLAAFASMPRPPQFDSVASVRTAIEGSGLYVSCLKSPYGSFYVSDRPLTRDDIDNVFFLKDCGLSPAWSGVVWISQIKTPSSAMQVTYIDGNWRAWGNASSPLETIGL